jgi:Mrp family chromosome partitioning ATPase
MDVLADEQRAPADVIVRTDVENLSVVPAGKPHPLAAELFRSRRMEYVLDQLGGHRQPGGHHRGRLMVFDSPPLLAASESQVLASHMGQVVVVVAAGRTRRQFVKSALQRLKASQYIGLILNMSALPAGENDYDSQHESHHESYAHND